LDADLLGAKRREPIQKLDSAPQAQLLGKPRPAASLVASPCIFDEQEPERTRVAVIA
jgi:hypothetical protein